MRINLGAGGDILTLSDGSDDANFIVPNDLVINMGGGNDVLEVNHVKVRHNASLTGGDGRDFVGFIGSVGAVTSLDSSFGDLTIDSGAGTDQVDLHNVFVRRNLTITTGIDSSNDLVNIEFSTVKNNTNISTGGGVDIVDLDDSSFNKRLTINVGDGDDGVFLHRCHVDELFAYLGAGDDILELEGTSGRRATLSGGSGVDALTRTDSPFSEFYQASSIS